MSRTTDWCCPLIWRRVWWAVDWLASGRPIDVGPVGYRKTQPALRSLGLLAPPVGDWLQGAVRRCAARPDELKDGSITEFGAVNFVGLQAAQI